MRVVEDDFAAEDADDKVACYFGYTWYAMVEAVERRVTCEVESSELKYLCDCHQ